MEEEFWFGQFGVCGFVFGSVQTTWSFLSIDWIFSVKNSVVPNFNESRWIRFFSLSRDHRKIPLKYVRSVVLWNFTKRQFMEPLYLLPHWDQAAVNLLFALKLDVPKRKTHVIRSTRNARYLKWNGMVLNCFCANRTWSRMVVHEAW